MNGIKYRSAEEMKDSGIEWIGKIPKEWFHRKIKFNSYVKGRIGWQGLKADEFIDSGPFLVTGTDFQHNSINWHTCYHVTDLRFLEAPEIHLRNDDLLITKDGTIGKLAIVQNCPEKAVLNSGIFVCRCMNQDYITRYLLYVLCSNVFSHFYELESGGSTIKHLYQETFEIFAFPLQGLDEQRKIASFLDIKTAQFDSIIAKKEQLIAKLEEAKKSLISEVVTGKVKIVDGQLVPRQPEEMKDSGVEWLGMIPKEWRACSIKHALEKSSNSIRVGPFGSQLKGEDFNGDFAKIYTQKNVIKCDLILGDDFVTKSKYSEMLAFKVSAGDILLTTRGTIGKIARVSHEAVTGIIHPTLIKFRINDSVLDYDLLQMLFNETDFIEKQVQYMSNSTTIPVIYSDTLKNLRIPLIPVEEQHRIVDFLKLKLRFIDVSIKEENVQLDLLKSAKQSLISEAVTGKIDLRDWEINEQGGAS